MLSVRSSPVSLFGPASFFQTRHSKGNSPPVPPVFHHSPNNQAVDSQIQGAHQDPQPNLLPPGQAGGVKDWNEIAIDEPSCVPSLSTENSETDFQRRQRTNPPRELYEHSP